MKKSFMIGLLYLLFISAKGQELGKETWINVSHKVSQLILVNNKIQHELEYLLFNIEKDTLSNIFKEYKYFQLYVKEDSVCQKLEFCLSNYPYKSKNIIGFFILKGYPVFVHNKLPDFLKLTECKKIFSYTEHKLGDLIIMEDDTPCWNIEYDNSQFKILHYPAKK